MFSSADEDERGKEYILNAKDAELYLPTAEDRKTTATTYATKHGAYQSADGYCWWWLRDTGAGPNMKLRVTYSGEIDEHGISIIKENGAVRPAVWVDLKMLEE